MGKHQQSAGPAQRHGFRATFGLLLQQPIGFLLGLLAILLVLAVVAVNVQNKYGGFWGALVGGGVAPLVGSWLLRARLNKRSRQ
jgi:hypothetical protein